MSSLSHNKSLLLAKLALLSRAFLLVVTCTIEVVFEYRPRCRELTSTMRCTKTVTPRKIEANRTNANRSTGPRSERGKRVSKFNSLTLGLFARHVAIPICDGDTAEKDFASLLDGLHDEFQPVGFYEEWLVVKIAESMWRLRRATRCESGSVRESAIWEGHRENDQLIAGLASRLWLLEDAEKQLRESGTLSQKAYAMIAPLVEEQQKNIHSAQGNEPVTAEIDPELFLTCIMARKELLDSMYKAHIRIEEDRSESLEDYNALVPGEEMDRILRYEERMHRQIDWAVQRLVERQERRLSLAPRGASP
jgi:hypothetical protein